VSLIIEAIKKAQQLRLQEKKEAPFFNNPGPRSENRRRSRKYFMVFSIPVLGLILLFSISGINPLSERTPPQGSKIAFVPGNPSPISPAEKKETPVVSKEADPPSQLEKPRIAAKILREEKREPPIMEEVVREEKAARVEPLETKVTPAIALPLETASQEEPKRVPPLIQETSASLSLPPAPPPPEASRKSFALEKEGEKNQPAQAADVLGHFNRGVYFYRQREMTQALQSYQKVIELDPAQVEAYNNMGILYQDLGDFNRAREAYQKALEINPQYEKAHHNLGTLFYLNNRYEESIAAFQKALLCNPRNIESYCNLGALYRKMGQVEKAVECYHKALAINSLHGETHFNLALLYEHAEKMEPAIFHYQKFIQLSSKTHPDLVTKVQRNVDHLMLTPKDRRK